MHEAQLHHNNSFITLTYSDEALHAPEREPTVPCTPPSKSVVALTNNISNAHAETHAEAESLKKSDLRKFIHRLYKDTRKKTSTKIRYYAVGEYGENTQRPHFHAAIYGEDFTDDRYPWRKSPSGHQLYRSSTLEKLWPHGAAEIGDLTFESAAYIARYIMKKINGKKADEHYKRVDSHGEIYWITPEFNVMSRRPGIGKKWIEKYGSDVYPHDYVIMKGVKHKPPRYYDKELDKVDRLLATLIKLEREFSSRSKAADNTPKRLAAKEKVAQARLNQSQRKL